VSRAAAGLRAQRAGGAFEASIEAANMGYAMSNVALVERLQLTGRFVKGKGFMPGASPVDFVGDILVSKRYIPIRFDCKSFAGDAWKYSEWNAAVKHNKFHQVVSLRHMDRFNGLAFALVRGSKLRVERTEGPNVHSYGQPTWLVPLCVVEYCMRKGQWSMSIAELDARCDFVDSTRVWRLRGSDWMPAAIELAKQKET
jgi:hypothetical protein